MHIEYHVRVPLPRCWGMGVEMCTLSIKAVSVGNTYSICKAYYYNSDFCLEFRFKAKRITCTTSTTIVIVKLEGLGGGPGVFHPCGVRFCVQSYFFLWLSTYDQNFCSHQRIYTSNQFSWLCLHWPWPQHWLYISRYEHHDYKEAIYRRLLLIFFPTYNNPIKNCPLAIFAVPLGSYRAPIHL